MNISGIIIGSNLSNIVRHKATLRAMARAGHFEYPVDAGHCYVNENDKPRAFVYKNKSYNIEYKDGCFFPFVVEKK